MTTRTPTPRVNWPALRAALALGHYQAAHGAAGPMRRDDEEYQRAYDEIEAHKARDVAALTAAWRAGRGRG